MPKILIIDDMDDNRDILVQILEEEHEVLEAKDAEEGLNTAREKLPDVILMDVSLPQMDGLTATSILKKDPKTKAIPIIAVTANAMVGDKERSIEAGCDTYITKPIDFSVLIKAVQGHLASK